MADEDTLPPCPRCDALKEQLAEMRAEFLQQTRNSQEMTTQLMLKLSEGQAMIQRELLTVIKEDRVLLREIVAMKKG